jgi:hypothetical protein
MMALRLEARRWLSRLAMGALRKLLFTVALGGAQRGHA